MKEIKKLKNELGEDLSIYGFEVKDASGISQNSHYLGYNDSEVAAFFIKNNIAGGHINIHSKFAVKRILERLDPNDLYSLLNLPQIEAPKPIDDQAVIEPISSEDRFLYSIMLTSDRFMDKKDSASLKRILGKYVKNNKKVSVKDKVKNVKLSDVLKKTNG